MPVLERWQPARKYRVRLTRRTRVLAAVEPHALDGAYGMGGATREEEEREENMSSELERVGRRCQEFWGKCQKCYFG